MVQTAGAKRLSVSLPSPLVEEFDAVWQGMKYDDRSKAVHDAIRNFITEHKLIQQEEGELIGAMGLLYYHDKPNLLNAITGIQHEYADVVKSSTHIHLAKEKCLEIIAVKGEADQVKSLMQKLMAKKGVKQVKFAAMSP